MTPAPTTASLQYVGNATMVLRFGSITVLTDPNFAHRGERVYLGKGISTRRLVEPALTIDRLPALDAVLLSHLHGDHWDRHAYRGLARDLPVVTTQRAARTLDRRGFHAAHGLDTWDDWSVARDDDTVTVTAVPGRHARGLARHLLPPVMGSIVDWSGPEGRRLRLYVTGDTLFIDDLREIPRRFPDIDVAVLHLGGTTLPGGLVVSMDAVEGTDLLEFLRPSSAVPVHHSDYTVFKSPLADFLAEAQRRGVGDLVRVVDFGETLALV